MANTERQGSIWKPKGWSDGEPVPRVTLPDGSIAEATASLTYTWNGSSWVKVPARTLLFAAITQGAAGTTSLVSASAANKIKVVSYLVVLDAAGSFKFTDGTVDLTGAIPCAINGGAAEDGDPSAWLFETAAINRALSITTVTGKAFGHLAYFLEA